MHDDLLRYRYLEYVLLLTAHIIGRFYESSPSLGVKSNIHSDAFLQQLKITLLFTIRGRRTIAKGILQQGLLENFVAEEQIDILQ